MKVSANAPGKIIFSGEHSVVYGMTGIATAINKVMKVSVQENATSDVRLECSVGKETFGAKLLEADVQRVYQLVCAEDSAVHIAASSTVLFVSDNRFISLTDFISIIKKQPFISDVDNPVHELLLTVAIFILLSVFQGGSLISGIDISATSEFPVASGLGSSAAFSVALSASLMRWSNCQNLYCDGSLSVDERSAINKIAFEAEKLVHGNPSGVDNSVSCFGGTLRFQTGKIEFLNASVILELLVIYTGIPRSTKAMVKKVKDFCESHPKESQIILRKINTITEDIILCLCRQYNIENESNEAAHRNFYDTIGGLIVQNHAYLDELGVGHQHFDDIKTICELHKAPFKLTGAGGGGCGFALITPDVRVTALKDALKSRGFDSFLCKTGCPGVAIY